MTTSLPRNTPGSRRVVPAEPSHEQVRRLRELLDQGERWVLRGDWPRFLTAEDGGRTVPIASLQRDQRVAAAAWISQQRHALHRAVAGVSQAPTGWVESLPLYRALTHPDD